MPDEVKPEAAGGGPDKPAAPQAAPTTPTPPSAPGAPVAKPAAPAAPAKPAGPAVTPWQSDTVTRLKQRFGEAIREASTYLTENYVVVDPARVKDICLFLRDEEKFNLLSDLTAVDYPKKPGRFEVIYQLYSFPRNERMRVKAATAEKIPSVVDVWKTANWLEREAYDMFGVIFEGHPDLRRILLPEEWQGFPLRKDHHILQQDDKWVQENLGIESGQ